MNYSKIILSSPNYFIRNDKIYVWVNYPNYIGEMAAMCVDIFRYFNEGHYLPKNHPDG